MTVEPYKPTKPRVLTMYPPNIGRIKRAFPVAINPGVVFTYGDTIYAPGPKRALPPEIMAHEMVHIEQQHGMNPEVWWAMYIGDPVFRFGMEIPAHKVEADYLRANGRDPLHVGARLISSFYGDVLPPELRGMPATDALYFLDHYSYGVMGGVEDLQFTEPRAE